MVSATEIYSFCRKCGINRAGSIDLEQTLKTQKDRQMRVVVTAQ